MIQPLMVKMISPISGEYFNRHMKLSDNYDLLITASGCLAIFLSAPRGVIQKGHYWEHHGK